MQIHSSKAKTVTSGRNDILHEETVAIAKGVESAEIGMIAAAETAETVMVGGVGQAETETIAEIAHAPILVIDEEVIAHEVARGGTQTENEIRIELVRQPLHIDRSRLKTWKIGSKQR
jgi:hypothetical protein